MTTTELDKELMGQFVAESMTNGVDIPFGLRLSEDFNIAAMQEQGTIWCMRSKMLMLSDIVEPTSMQGQFAVLMKQHMQNDFHHVRAMSYLYDSAEESILVQQISMLAMHAAFKDVKDIYNIERTMECQSLNPESACSALAIYTYFTICFNRHLSPNRYNELFIKSWYNYYENWLV